MPKVHYLNHDAAIAELNRVYHEYDVLVAEYNELLRAVKLVLAGVTKANRINQCRLARIEALEQENEELWWLAQQAKHWRDGYRHLELLIEADLEGIDSEEGQ